MNKKRFSICILTIFFIVSVYARETIVSVFQDSKKETDLSSCLKNGLIKLEVNLDEEIPEENLSAIRYILKHTYENNIHKMRGEEDNKVYTKESGEEAVFDKEGNLVTNDWNKGSFNYGSYSEPINKFKVDIWPWLIWGNTREDPTSFDERFYYYIMDLDNGIQSYIFLEDKTEIEKINYANLNETDKLIYKFFNYLIFNKSYTFDLSKKNIAKYKKSADNYWKYLSQLLTLSGYEK